MAVQAQLCAENIGFPACTPQDLSMENNGFCYNLQQPNMQFQQLQNMQQNESFCVDSNNNCSNNTHRSMAFSQILASESKQQRLDIDGLIGLQNERLRLALQEQRKQQLVVLLKGCESRAQMLLRKKDEEIAVAMNRSIELQNFVKKMETENQAWQRVAKQNEAIITAMNNTIEQLRETACHQFSGQGAQDAESCCDIILPADETATAAVNLGNGLMAVGQENKQEQRTRKMMCQSCNSRASCVLLLPCRHLCSCKDCAAYIYSCPVCGMEKKGTIVALI